MKILKILFPLSYRFATDKQFFFSLIGYIAIYIIGCLIPIRFTSLIASVYVFVGGGILLANYLVKSKGDPNEK